MYYFLVFFHCFSSKTDNKIDPKLDAIPALVAEKCVTRCADRTFVEYMSRWEGFVDLSDTK